MKKTLFILMLFISGLSFSQEQSALIEDFKMSLSLESMEQLQSFDFDDVESVYENLKTCKTLVFKVSCNFDKKLGKGNLLNTSFIVEGTSIDLEQFMSNIRRVKSAIENIYNLKS